jgi:hypothetical protein
MLEKLSSQVHERTNMKEFIRSVFGEPGTWVTLWMDITVEVVEQVAVMGHNADFL